MDMLRGFVFYNFWKLSYLSEKLQRWVRNLELLNLFIILKSYIDQDGATILMKQEQEKEEFSSITASDNI